MDNVSPTAQILDSFVEDTAKVYNNVRLYNSSVGHASTIGDYSTLRESSLGMFCHIQRHCDIMRTSIGNYTCIERMSVAHDVKIGSFCAISWNVSIGGDNHDYLQPTIHPFYYNSVFGIEPDPQKKIEQDIAEANEEPCVIGNDVWIGCGVIINRGLTIGNGACIGSGSVVTKDVPPYAVVVGVPARVIKYRYPQHIIERMEKIQWWNWPKELLIKYRDIFKMHVDEELLTSLENISKGING